MVTYIASHSHADVSSGHTRCYLEPPGPTWGSVANHTSSYGPGWGSNGQHRRCRVTTIPLSHGPQHAFLPDKCEDGILTLKDTAAFSLSVWTKQAGADQASPILHQSQRLACQLSSGGTGAGSSVPSCWQVTLSAMLPELYMLFIDPVNDPTVFMFVGTWNTKQANKS